LVTILGSIFLVLFTNIENQLYGLYGHSTTRLLFLWLTCLLFGAALILRSTATRALIVGLILLAAVSGTWQSWRLLTVEPRLWAHLRFAARIKELTERNAPIIVGTMWKRPGWIQHRTAQGEYLFHDPVDFYLGHRKGWSINDTKLTASFVEELRRRGARYFAIYCCDYTESDTLKLDERLRNYLVCNHTELAIDPQWAIYRLDDARRSTNTDCER
jgi:hypothetical protein